MAAAILVTIFAGFAPSFYLRGLVPAYRPYLPMTWLVALHGLIFSGWALLFVTQVTLASEVARLCRLDLRAVRLSSVVRRYFASVRRENRA